MIQNILILPDLKIENSFVDKIKYLIEFKFTDEGKDIQIVSKHAYDQLDVKQCENLNSFRKSRFKSVSILNSEKKNVLKDLKSLKISYDKLYLINDQGIISLAEGTYSDDENKHLYSHTFNELGPRKDKTFTYFPYGYLYNYQGAGPVNEMGFRISESLHSYIDRDKNHKLIAVFGGSGAFSIYTQHHEMFSAQLEKQLNENDPNFEYSVINFGLGGGTVINDMMNYLLYAQNLKPDAVICHCGANDLRFGVISDKHLLNEYNITYLGNFEAWSKILHEHPEVRLDYFESDDVPIRNLPSESIKAFSFRIEQFKNLVESNASKFFIGLQPTIWSKQEISTQEKEYVEDSIENTSQGRFKTLNKKMAYLYERLDQNSMLTDIGELINLHDYFKHFTENDTLFRDYVIAQHPETRRLLINISKKSVSILIIPTANFNPELYERI